MTQTPDPLEDLGTAWQARTAADEQFAQRSAEVVRLIDQALESGVTMTQIARRVGAPLPAIRSLHQRAKRTPPRPRSGSRTGEARTGWAEPGEVSLRDLAEALGVTVVAVRKRLLAGEWGSEWHRSGTGATSPIVITHPAARRVVAERRKQV